MRLARIVSQGAYVRNAPLAAFGLARGGPHVSTACPLPVPDPADAFARATAGRLDRLRLYRGTANETEDAPWPAALPAAGYAVYLRDHAGRWRTVAFDLDASRGSVAADARVLCGLLDAAAVRHVVCCSDGTEAGGRHILVPFTPGLSPETVAALRSRLQRLLPSLDASPLADSWTVAIRPPLAPHRLGGASRIAAPADTPEALRTLQRPNINGAAERLLRAITGRAHVSVAGVARLRRQPTRRTMELLRNGDTTGRYPVTKRSGAEQAIITGLVNAGWTDEEIRAAFDDPANAGCAKYRERAARSPAAGGKYLDDSIGNARRFTSERPPAASRAIQDLDELLAAAVHWSPGGRTGETDAAVLRAHARAARLARSRVYGLAWRTCAEWAGVSRKAVRAAEGRLAAAGWINREDGRTDGGSACWRLALAGDRVVSGYQSLPHGGVGKETGIPTQQDAGHPLWHSGAAGPGPRATWAALQAADGPLTAAALATATHHHRSTVGDHLRLLQGIGLAAQTPAGWVATGRSLDDALGELPPDAQTAAQRQRERHQRERAAWRARKGTG